MILYISFEFKVLNSCILILNIICYWNHIYAIIFRESERAERTNALFIFVLNIKFKQFKKGKLVLYSRNISLELKMVYLKGAALFVTLLILAISQSEGGVIGDCWERHSDCTTQNYDTGSGFLSCAERCVCLGYGKGHCVSHSRYTCHQLNRSYRCMCALRRRGHRPTYCRVGM